MSIIKIMIISSLTLNYHDIANNLRNILAVGVNYIKPTEGKCNVELPPDAVLQDKTDSANHEHIGTYGVICLRWVVSIRLK